MDPRRNEELTHERQFQTPTPEPNALFVFWPSYMRDSDGGERWGGPCITVIRERAKLYAAEGVPVMEYSLVGPLE